MKELYERWLPVVGYEGFYEVSNHGRVRSLRRQTLGRNGKPKWAGGRVLSQTWDGYYFGVGLSKEGKPRRCRTHQLVAEAFLGPRPEGQVVCHGAAGRKFNNLSNLSYGTKQQNQLDRFRDGTDCAGSKQWRSKLTESIVRQCRLDHKNGEPVVRLAENYGVDAETMRDAIKLRTWKHVS